MFINALVEGVLDEAVASRLIKESGRQFSTCYGKRGCGYIQQKVRGFNNAAAALPILTLIDFMDTGLECPARVVSDWLPHRHENMLFRVVVSEIESWLLADATNIASFLQIPTNRVPTDPEALNDPKQVLVNLARRSRSSKVRSSLVPAQGSTAQVGTLYVSEMMRFVHNQWDIVAAQAQSPSLGRCVTRLEELN